MAVGQLPVLSDVPGKQPLGAGEGVGGQYEGQ